MAITDKIFGYFGSFEKINDTFKDVDGKGIYERYNESLGLDFDENLGGLIEDLLQNTLVPMSTLDRFVVYLEQMLGIRLGIFNTLEGRRKYLELFNRICDIKGTVRAYKIMLMWLGFDQVNIIEHPRGSGFDSEFTFDHSRRRFDAGRGCGCREYSIQLEGNNLIDQDIIQQIFNIIEFNEPIDARIRSLTMNGGFLVQNVIDIYISDGTDGNIAGDLIYNNDNDPELFMRLAERDDEPQYIEGDLIIEGPNSDKYTINSSGDLIFTTGSFFFNNALKLNGSGEHVEYPVSNAYNFGTNDFSISFWLKLDTNQGNHPIISKTNGSTGFFVSYINGIMFFEFSDSQGTCQISLNETIDEIGHWYHIVIHKNGTDGNDYNVYVNSVPVQFNVMSNNLVDGNIDNNALLFIGRKQSDYGIFTIDEFILKSGELTQQEVELIYNFGDGEDALISGVGNIALRSNFDELIGINIFDQSTNQNHGQLNAPGDLTNRILH